MPVHTLFTKGIMMNKLIYAKNLGKCNTLCVNADQSMWAGIVNCFATQTKRTFVSSTEVKSVTEGRSVII